MIDPEVYEELYRKYYGRLYKYCLFRVTGAIRTRPERRLYGIFSFLVLALCL